MPIPSTKKRFSVDEYYQLAEVGILHPDDRVELIDGEIITMSPIGMRHLGCVNRAHRLLNTALIGKAVVSVQNPVQLTSQTEPQPDIAVLRFRADDYYAKKPVAEDTLLVLEVSETTLRFDRRVKLPHYAKAGIQEVWIEDVEAGQLLAFRDPKGGEYRTVLTLRRGESVAMLAFPDIEFKVDDLLPGSLHF